MRKEVDWQNGLDQASIDPERLLSIWYHFKNSSQNLTLTLVIGECRVSLCIANHDVFECLLHLDQGVELVIKLHLFLD